jgi:hypothetical protein
LCGTATIVAVRSQSVKLRHSRGGTPKHTQTVLDVTQKETSIDQQQHSCETQICQRHRTILRIFSSAAMARTRWRVCEIYCPTTYIINKQKYRERSLYSCLFLMELLIIETLENKLLRTLKYDKVMTIHKKEGLDNN